MVGVAHAGPAAEVDSKPATLAEKEKGNASSASPSNSSDVVLEPKTQQHPVAAERSKGKVALIMGALCVSFTIVNRP